jgi:hypothetical protein
MPTELGGVVADTQCIAALASGLAARNRIIGAITAAMDFIPKGVGRPDPIIYDVDATEVVDVLFMDEAAQMSLANMLAASPAARIVVLIGAPQRLDQPMHGRVIGACMTTQCRLFR